MLYCYIVKLLGCSVNFVSTDFTVVLKILNLWRNFLPSSSVKGKYRVRLPHSLMVKKKAVVPKAIYCFFTIVFFLVCMMKYEANNGNLIKNLNILPHQFSVSYCPVIGVIIIKQIAICNHNKCCNFFCNTQ